MPTIDRRNGLAALALALGCGLTPLAVGRAEAQAPPVKVGELNSYGRFAAFAVPYRNGMQLALDEINAAGGVLGGRKLEFVFRDDGSTPGDAVRVAEELLTREGASFLVGTFLSNVGLAVADFANQKKTLFIASEPLTDGITMAAGALQRSGLIEYHRGDFTVLDRGGLEAAACGCYKTDLQAYAELLH